MSEIELVDKKSFSSEELIKMLMRNIKKLQNKNIKNG